MDGHEPLHAKACAFGQRLLDEGESGAWQCCLFLSLFRSLKLGFFDKYHKYPTSTKIIIY